MEHKKKIKQKKGKKNYNINSGCPCSISAADASEQNQCSTSSGNVDAQIVGELTCDADMGRDRIDGARAVTLNMVEELDLPWEAVLEGSIRYLLTEKKFWIQKEVTFEEKILYLQNEKDSWLQKEASMEESIKQLSNEKDAWILLQVGLEDRIRKLEREKESWALKEEKVHHVSKDENKNAQLEEMLALVKKLKTEITDLVEKVKELASQILIWGTSRTVGSCLTAGFDPGVSMSETSTVADSMPLFSKKRMESPATTNQNEEQMVIADHADRLTTESDGTGDSEENVKVPLDENKIQEIEPLSDAPLIGASSGLISLVTKYVSGADLVAKKRCNSGK